MLEQNKGKERIHWVDVMKGLLILIVVFHHLPQNAIAVGYDNDFWVYYDNLKRYYCCWFMASFFIATGLCSNFNKPFKDFFISSFKTLVVPAVIIHSCLDLLALISEGFSLRLFYFPIKRLLLLGNDWFLTSLFLAKLSCWCISNFINNNRNKILAGGGLMIVGFLMHDFHITNIWYHQHAFAMCIFLLVGMLAKKKIFAHNNNFKHISISRYELISTTCLILSFFIFDFFQVRIPALNFGFKVSVLDIPLYLYFSIMGTIAAIALSKLIDSNKILEYIGRNTIIVYLLHVFILRIMLKELRFYDHDVLSGLFIASITFAISITFCLVCSFVINKTKLKVIVGKF